MNRVLFFSCVAVMVSTCADFDQAEHNFCLARPELCDAGVSLVDAGLFHDAGVTDAGPVESGTDAGADSGVTDSGVADSGSVDAGEVDAGSFDAGGVDAGGVDAGMPDASVTAAATWEYQLGGLTCTALNITGVGANTAGIATVIGTYSGNDCDVGTNGGSTNAPQMFIARFADGGAQLSLLKNIAATPSIALTLEDNTSVITILMPGGGPSATDIPFGPTAATTCHSGGNGNFGNDPSLCMVKMRPDGGAASATSVWMDLAANESKWKMYGSATGTGGLYALSAFSYGNFNSQPAGAFIQHGGSGSMIIGYGTSGFWSASNTCGQMTSVAIDRSTNDVFGSGSSSQTPNGNCTFSGPTDQPLSLSGGPMLAVKYNSDGALVWVHAFAGWPLVGNAVITAGSSSGSQSVWFGASLLGTMSDPLLPDGGFTSDENGSSDLVVVKLFGSNGGLRPSAAKRFGSDGDDVLTSAQLDADGGLWLFGSFAGHGLDFGGGPLDAPDGGLFVARLDAQTFAHRQSWVVPASGAVPSMVGVTVGGALPIAGGTFSGTINVGSGPLVSTPPGVSGWVGTLSHP